MSSVLLKEFKQFTAGSLPEHSVPITVENPQSRVFRGTIFFSVECTSKENFWKRVQWIIQSKCDIFSGL